MNDIYRYIIKRFAMESSTDFPRITLFTFMSIINV